METNGICGSCLGSKLGLLFILVDEMNEGFDQVVVDLAEPVKQ
jgi:hypothetical protein